MRPSARWPTAISRASRPTPMRWSGTCRALGFGEAFGRALVDCNPADLVAVAFTPKAAFRQTPGPNAGAPLER